MKIDNSGLGSESSEIPISPLEAKSSVKMVIGWKKMQNRYKAAEKSELTNAFNDQDDEDDEEGDATK